MLEDITFPIIFISKHTTQIPSCKRVKEVCFGHKNNYRNETKVFYHGWHSLHHIPWITLIWQSHLQSYEILNLLIFISIFLVYNLAQKSLFTCLLEKKLFCDQAHFCSFNYKNQKLYPSVSLTPTANPAIKAHKPSKDFPVRLITSHIGAPQENLASNLNDLLKPFIEKSPMVCKNSTHFVEQTKKNKVGPNEKMVSFDATALFPSVLITEAIQLI